MTEVQLDCRGLPCPQPVLECKRALSDGPGARLVITVDNEAARENVSRFLRSQGCSLLSVDQEDGCFILSAEPASADQAEEATASEAPARQGPQTAPAVQDQQLVLIASDVIGHGDEALGRKLMANFIATLPEMGPSLWRILLINAGVKLAVQESPVLEQLQKLASDGVRILVCGTCLDHFQLLEAKRVGETTNMLDVVTSLQLASKVITV